MKKVIFKIVIILLLSVGLLFGVTACTNDTVEPEFFTITYTAIGGRIEGEATQIVEKGKDGTAITAVADEGYLFRHWRDDVFETTRQEKNVQKDISVTAIFEKRIINANYRTEEGGYIEGNITWQGVPYGEDAKSTTALASEGYDFNGWSDGVTTATRQDKELKKEFNVTAKFKKQPRQISYSASKGGKIEGELTQNVLYGDTGTTVTAIPNMGYKFVKWSDNDSTDPIRTDIIKNNIIVTAEFGYQLSDGSGTIEKPISINTYEQFLEITKYPNLHYKLKYDGNAV